MAIKKHISSLNISKTQQKNVNHRGLDDSKEWKYCLFLLVCEHFPVHPSVPPSIHVTVTDVILTNER